MGEGNNKVKRILALSGVVILVLMYVLTLVFAVFDNPNTMSFFWASFALTFFVPIIIFGIQSVYSLVSRKDANSGTDEYDVEDEDSDDGISQGYRK